jgi:hypothetical protein
MAFTQADRDEISHLLARVCEIVEAGGAAKLSPITGHCVPCAEPTWVDLAGVYVPACHATGRDAVVWPGPEAINALADELRDTVPEYPEWAVWMDGHHFVVYSRVGDILFRGESTTSKEDAAHDLGERVKAWKGTKE